MVYPPGHHYTPEPEDINISKEPRDGKTWEQAIPSRDPLDYEVGEFKSESQYVIFQTSDNLMNFLNPVINTALTPICCNYVMLIFPVVCGVI